MNFFKEKYTVNNYNFKESYYEKTKTEDYTNNDVLKFSNSNISVNEFLNFLKNHYDLLLTKYNYNRVNYNANNKLYEKYNNRKDYTLVKNIGYKSDIIIKTSKFDYFFDETNKLFVITRVSENISDQELKELVFNENSPTFHSLKDIKRNVDTYKKNLDDLEQSINFIKTNYSELII